MKKMNHINCDQVIILTEIPILNLLNMEIKIKENEHARLWIKAVLQKDGNDDIDSKLADGSPIKVIERNSKLVLFAGKIEEVKICQITTYCEVEILGYSSTMEMDHGKKKTSYQDTELTYEQVVEAVAGRNDKVKYVWNVEKFRKIQFPIIQYEETDWEFLRRLASHFQTVIYPDTVSNEPSFYFGMMKGQQRNLSEIEVVRYGCNRFYYTDGLYGKDETRSYAKYMQCQSSKLFKIGDYFDFHGSIYTIFQFNIKLINGIVLYIYLLGTDGMYSQKKYFNNAISGVQLRGTVKGRVKESIFVHLDIDEEEHNLYSWPFVPNTGNICYCMPEIGARVILYFPTYNEAEGIVAYINNDNSANTVDMNTQNREFITECNKKICMYPQHVEVSGYAEKILLSDNMGIEFNSKTEIKLNAAKDISINGMKVSLRAPLELICKTQKSNIDICRDFNFYAPSGVTMQGTSQGAMENRVISKDKKEEIEYWKAAFSAMASIPAMDLKRVDHDSIIDLKACGSVAQFGKGSTTFAMKEVMEGKREGETSFPDAFRAMEAYTVKGGYLLPEINEK